jgi:IclR family pca regulon transcriptional regulator
VTDKNDRDIIQSLIRGLDVIRAFTREKPRMTVAEVARSTGMTRATVRRFLLTLTRAGYVDFDGKSFSLGSKVLELSFSAMSSGDVWEVMQLVMNEVAEKLQECCFAAVLEKDSVVYVARAMVPRLLTVGVPIGNRMPAYRTSTGRVLLAGQPDDVLESYLRSVRIQPLTTHAISTKADLRTEIFRVREQGFAISSQEAEVGLHAISVPIYGPSTDTVIAALNVGCPMARVSARDLRNRVLPEMLAASRRITQATRG